MSAMTRRRLAERMKEDNDDDDVVDLDSAIIPSRSRKHVYFLSISLIPDGASVVTSSLF